MSQQYLPLDGKIVWPLVARIHIYIFFTQALAFSIFNQIPWGRHNEQDTSPTDGLMLAYRLQRCTNIDPAMG